MKKYVLFCLASFVLSLAGCGGGTQKASTSGGAKQKKAGALSKDMFALTIDGLNRTEQSQTEAVQAEIQRQLLALGQAATGGSAQSSSTLLAAWPESDALRQIVDRLDQWIRAQPPPEWRLDPLLAELPEALRKMPPAAGLDKLEIGPFDGYYLQEAVYLRDVALAARGKSIDDLLRAGRLFDWTIRNLQLEKDTPERIPQFPWEALFFGRATALERAWVFILLARQEGLDAAILAIDRKSENVPAGAPRPAAEFQPWCVAVRIDGKAYLFDLDYGLPIPGPGGVKRGANGQLDIVPADLDQLLADESLLARMSVDAEHPYPMKQADLQRVAALVEASPAALSRRMKAVESHLQGKQKMVLTVSASQQAERWKTTPGVAAAEPWRLPYETIRRRSELKPAQVARRLADFLPFYAMPSVLLHGEEVLQKAAKTPKDLQDIYKGAAAEGENKKRGNPADAPQDTESHKLRRAIAAVAFFSSTYAAPLYKGRVLQLKGQMSGEVSAMNYYQMSRPSAEQLRTIQEKLFGELAGAALADHKNMSDEEKMKLVSEIVEAIMTGKTLRDAESRQIAAEIAQNGAPFVEEQTALIALGKADASYWLGLITYERESFRSAVDYFTTHTLNAWPGGPWTAGANYNLGRTLETGGEIDKAVEVYRSNADAPDFAGQLLRANWLEAGKKKPEAEKSPEIKSEPLQPEEPKSEAPKVEEPEREEPKGEVKPGAEENSGEKKSENKTEE
ncbi:MAG: hypothetical protein IT426_18300 [Pirellulales bacterium]|nr:hypothetical protein [Pirellulales bacterium]